LGSISCFLNRLRSRKANKDFLRQFAQSITLWASAQGLTAYSIAASYSAAAEQLIKTFMSYLTEIKHLIKTFMPYSEIAKRHLRSRAKQKGLSAMPTALFGDSAKGLGLFG